MQNIAANGRMIGDLLVLPDETALIAGGYSQLGKCRPDARADYIDGTGPKREPVPKQQAVDHIDVTLRL